MRGPRFVVVWALLMVVAAVVAIALVGRSAVTQAGRGDGASDQESVIGAEYLHVLDVALDASDVRPRPSRRARSVRRVALAATPVRAPSSVGEYLDPDAFYPVWSAGHVSDVGEFNDPEDDVSIPYSSGATADVGDCLEPEVPP